MRPARENRRDNLPSFGSRLLRPTNQPLRRPISPLTMRARSVLRLRRRRPPRPIAALVQRDAYAPVPRLHHCGRRAHVNLRVYQLARHAVVTVVVREMVINVYAHPELPLAELVAKRGERSHRWTVELLESR